MSVLALILLPLIPLARADSGERLYDSTLVAVEIEPFFFAQGSWMYTLSAPYPPNTDLKPSKKIVCRGTTAIKGFGDADSAGVCGWTAPNGGNWLDSQIKVSTYIDADNTIQVRVTNQTGTIRSETDGMAYLNMTGSFPVPNQSEVQVYQWNAVD